MFFRIAIVLMMIVTGVSAEDAESKEQGAMKLRKTGETKFCVRKGDIYWFNIISSNTILFSTRDGYYLNQIANNCYFPPNNDDVRVTIYTKASRPDVYCRNDAITAGRVHGPGSRCRLRLFEEAVEVEADAEKLEN